MLLWRQSLSRLSGQSKILPIRCFAKEVKPQVPNVSRVYQHVNQERGEDYWNYSKYPLTFGSLADYKLGASLGSGKYSEVFEAVHLGQRKNYILKLLKAPKAPSVVQREVKILKTLADGPNISKLVDLVRDPNPESTAVGLVFEATPCVDIKKNYKTFTDLDVRYYMYQLLRALDYAHSHGIMHRDVKMGNILVDPTTKMLRLIDWGLAEYYHPGQEYSLRVATRHYKGPELLVNVKDYDYSLDMWSLGCTFAGLLFMKSPFFPGKDNDEQLMKFTKILGTHNFWKWIDSHHIPMAPEIRMIMTGEPKVSWRTFETSLNYHLHSNDAFDLLDRLLQWEPRARITAQEAMSHPYFAPVINKDK